MAASFGGRVRRWLGRGEATPAAPAEAPVEGGPSAAVDTRNHDYDVWTAEIIRRTLGPSSTGIDVGAHSGLILTSIVEAAPAGRHHAFEPIPLLAEGLRADFPQVEVHAVALAAEAGHTTFQHVVSNPSFSGIQRRTYTQDEQIETIDVVMARLDDEIDPDVPVAFVKIDVEGGELGVLQGATRTVSEHRPVVVFEFGAGAANHYGTTPADISDYFSARDMRVSLLDTYLAGGPAFSADELERQYEQQLNYYFVAHP